MPRYNLKSDTLVFIEGVPHTPVADPGSELVRLANATSGAVYLHRREDGSHGVPTLEEFDAMVAAGVAEVAEDFTRRAVEPKFRFAEWDSVQCELEDAKSAKMLAECNAFEDAGIPNGLKAMDIAKDEVWTPELVAKHGPLDNLHSIKRWRSERGRPGARKQRDMIRLWGRTGGTSIHPVVQECMIRAAFGTLEGGPHSKTTSAYVVARREIKLINSGRHPDYDKPDKAYKSPSKSTMWRLCKSLRSAAATTIRDGRHYMNAVWRGAGEGLRATRALELGIIDHSPVPLIVVVDQDLGICLGRPWLTILLDVATDCIVGWVLSFNDPSEWSVAEVLRRANRLKRPPSEMAAKYPGLAQIHGKHGEILVDNAKEFRGHTLESIAAGSGMAVTFCPIKEPRYRAPGERMFGTIWSRLLEDLPGSTMPIEYSRKADYDPEKDAIVTMQELEALINQVIAEIHLTPSEALDNRPPLLMWQRSVEAHGIDRWWDVETATKELMTPVDGLTLSKSGIRLHNMRYFDPEAVPILLDDLVPMEPGRSKRGDPKVTVRVKFDPADISRVHVWNRRTLRYVTLHCDCPSYSEGMPLWLHTQIRESAKADGLAFDTEQDYLDARARRIAAVKALKPNAKRSERSKFAKLLEIPRVRQVVGNITILEPTEPEPVSIADYISLSLIHI